MSLRIIAIKPLKGRNPDCLKILKPQSIYYFNMDYAIDRFDRIRYVQSMPEMFYGTSTPNINISAIVGKNGSGKSSIIDLMLRLINNLGKKHDKHNLELTHIKGLNAALYYEINGIVYKLNVNDSDVDVFRYSKFGIRQRKPIAKFELKDFFYTITVNYSHYAYNIRDFATEGKWLDGLFHKNDGYQTPLVINPFRIEGNIEINNENHLAKARLISNFLGLKKGDDVQFRKVNKRLIANVLKLSLNESKENTVLYRKTLVETQGKKMDEPITLKKLTLDREKILSGLNKVYDFNYRKLDKVKYKVALDYILYKLVSICIKYSEYSPYFIREEKIFNPNTLNRFLSELIYDDSHITFKLKQTLNFLRFEHIELKDQTITLDELSNRIIDIRKKNKRRFFEISHFVPPPIFFTEVMLKASATSRTIPFEYLSSGERQMLYSVSSLLYHLKNLDSIRKTKRRIAYRYVNILLEEVELYFHPEMQKSYIKYILDNIEKLQLKFIKAINLIFVTHSPFILSDIPESRILFLDETGYPKTNRKGLKTFGGNIHDLLADSFFLGNGFIGDFAKEKIQFIIDELNKALNEKRQTPVKILAFIEMIGEPFLREKLLEMYYQTVPSSIVTLKKIRELKEEIKRLKNDQTTSK